MAPPLFERKMLGMWNLNFIINMMKEIKWYYIFFDYIISALLLSAFIAFVLLNWNTFVEHPLFEDIFQNKA